MDPFDGILKNSIAYLHNISNAMNSNFPSVKSYYACKSRILELKYNTFLPATMTKASIRCPRCCLSFDDYTPCVRIKPKNKVSRFSRKVLRKMKENKSLTLYQQRHSILKNPTDVDHNILSKMCLVCRREAEVVIKKEKKIFQPPKISISKMPKKKKKKKDKFCGLTPSAVISTNKKESSEVKKSPAVDIQNNNCQKSDRQTVKEPAFNIKVRKGKQTSPIKYNVIGKIEEISSQNISKRRLKVKKKTAKQRVMEKKFNKDKQKAQSKLEKILSTSGKSNASNVLKNFLKDL